MKMISIVIPNFNDDSIIQVLYKRVKNAMIKDFPDLDWEMIMVDDGSSDQTFKYLQDLNKNDKRVKIVKFSRNFGHHVAITAGLDHASGDYVVMMDGDLQDRPEDIILLFNKLKDGYDVVYGVRINKQFGFFKKFTSEIFNVIIKSMMTEKIVINSTIFRIMTKQVVDSLREFRENNRYLVGLIGWVGFRHIGQPVTHGKRYSGQSKYSFSKQFILALNAISSFTDYPLKLASRLGFLTVMLSAILAFVVIYRKLFFGIPILGWASLIVLIIFFNGIQMVILGIMGEYLGRNYLESKRRPLYIVEKKLGF